MSLLRQSLKVHDKKSLNLVLAAIERAERKGLEAPGIADEGARIVFAMQIIESIRRVQFATGLLSRQASAERASHQSALFDPIRGAAFLGMRGDQDEASWLVFLATHFGQRPGSKWALVRAFYSGDQHGPWTWKRASMNVDQMLTWLESRKDFLKSAGKFGGHRPYESLGASGTGATLGSYVEWVNSYGSHTDMFENAFDVSEHDGGLAFAFLYDDMKRVKRFGRLAKFDYLCMLGKLDIANIWPLSMYVASSTGPKRGGALLLGQGATPSQMEKAAQLLDAEMKVGMQVFEDALCNWQKSPNVFVSYRG